jgi:hypothetical protein
MRDRKLSYCTGAAKLDAMSSAVILDIQSLYFNGKV